MDSVFIVVEVGAIARAMSPEYVCKVEDLIRARAIAEVQITKMQVLLDQMPAY